MNGVSTDELLTSYAGDGRPYVRWWWFASSLERKDIDYQLDWIVSAGFGGVELSWVYPTGDAATDIPRWLSQEWQELVRYTAEGCVRRGIGCDLTLGTLWPFGGSWVAEDDASMTVDGLSAQRLRDSWEAAHGLSEAYIVNHLDGAALRRYCSPMIAALESTLSATQGGSHPTAFFSDSWEVETEGLWRDGFGDGFEAAYGYRLEPHMTCLESNRDVLYDYFEFRSKLVLKEFFEPLSQLAEEAGALSRVQAHGAPTDLLAAYATSDVPESEALLFDPEFSSIAASAACQSAKPVVSAEAFTCLYGWVARPGTPPMIGSERSRDLKLVADALFANGVNHIVWHGMPFNGPDQHRRFYATTHVGPDSSFADEIPSLNVYMRHCAEFLRSGWTATEVAVYLPLEDAVADGRLSAEEARPSATYAWEMQHQRLPESLWGYRPVWTSEHFLSRAKVSDGGIQLGSCSVSAVWVDVWYLSLATLSALLRIARQGGRICILRRPQQIGSGAREEFENGLAEIESLPSVQDHMEFAEIAPLVRTPSGTAPPFWARRVESGTRFFFAHPGTLALRYPLDPEITYADNTMRLDLEFPVRGDWRAVELTFGPGESRLVEVPTIGQPRVVA